MCGTAWQHASGVLSIACHMRRRIHVSYEEEDTCVALPGSTQRTLHVI